MTPTPSALTRPSLGYLAILMAALLLAGFLSGCGSFESGLQRDAARQLQARVLGASEAAAASDPARALKFLEALVADLEASTRNWDVS